MCQIYYATATCPDIDELGKGLNDHGFFYPKNVVCCIMSGRTLLTDCFLGK